MLSFRIQALAILKYAASLPAHHPKRCELRAYAMNLLRHS